MRTLGDMAKALNRSPVVLAGLAKAVRVAGAGRRGVFGSLPKGYCHEMLAAVVEYVLPSEDGGKWKV